MSARNEPTRAVWLSKSEIDRILECNASFATWDVLMPLVVKRWEAAPANPAEAVARVIAFGGLKWEDAGEFHRQWCRGHANRVLAALGLQREVSS